MYSMCVSVFWLFEEYVDFFYAMVSFLLASNKYPTGRG